MLLMFLLFISALSHAQFTQISSPFNKQIRDITQDSQGLIWIASETAVTSFDGYQFESIKMDEGSSENTIGINDIEITADNVMLIATNNSGLLYYQIDAALLPQPVEQITDEFIFKVKTAADITWAVSQGGVYKINGVVNQRVGVDFYPFDVPKRFINNISIRENQLWIAAVNQLIRFDTDLNIMSTIEYPQSQKNLYIWDTYINDSGDLVISTDSGLHTRNHTAFNWASDNSLSVKYKVNATVAGNNNLWHGTTTAGLINRSKKDRHHAVHLSQASTNITTDSVTTLFLDKDQNLWVGSFDGSIHMLAKNALAFGLNLNMTHLPGCQSIAGNVIGMHEDDENNLWIVTQKKLVKVNREDQQCHPIELQFNEDSDASIVPMPTAIFSDQNGQVWVVTYPISLIPIKNSNLPISLNDYHISDSKKLIYRFVTQTDDSIFVFATSRGLASYDIETNELISLAEKGKKSDGGIIYDVFPVNKEGFLMATSRGLVAYDGETVSSHEMQQQLPTKRINTVFIDSSDYIWVGTKDAGLFKFDPQYKLVKNFSEVPLLRDQKDITNILEDDHKNLWFSTLSNIIKLNLVTNEVIAFDATDGLQNKKFNSRAALKSNDGKLYFGGHNGMNVFDPQEININDSPPPIQITQLTRFNQTVRPLVDYDGFQIDRPINFVEELILSHQDYVLGFEFAALDYANPEVNQYAYMLQGFDPDWNYVNANKRSASYTNLPRGEYHFKVKGSNKFGVWNETGQSIKITVKPAPWLSWWAFLCYAVLVSLLVLLYISKKTKDAKKQAALLKQEVNNKTAELKVQKQAIETLLSKKNELFANVSHEFRTPLTLILGPIKELLDKQVEEQDIKHLHMVNRNANRLLSLVEQLLQLARVSNLEKIKTTAQNTLNQIDSLVDSFQHLAKSKRIQLKSVQNDQATIDVTDQFIDAVLGNLVSNAIKYTPKGGAVEVRAQVTKNLLKLSVKDTGAGLTAEQQKDIFRRFKRLDSHQAIEGIGIGLSVVEEVVKINQGEVKVNSEIGKGSEFIIEMPLADAQQTDEPPTTSSLVRQLQAESLETVSAPVISDDAVETDNLNTVLVIEDNHDMRQHITTIIRPYYHCLAAANGIKGIATAIEQVPDIIISDVMMPEMDGFKVARIIRSDQRTSHIPLMLLTALNDKTSRIKGWREHVDAYMTKPFDRDELLVQLESMLTIRDILKKKAGHAIAKHKGTQSILPKKDQEFIDQLKKIIEENYHDPILNRQKIASKMAVSERQLQRKLKAMVDQNPMDLLREYRLKVATRLLKDGYQVSQVADNCGFNSLSYFSQCFKAQFGLTPKKYQMSE